MGSKTAQPVQRHYQRLDAIAEARRHSDIQARRAEIRAAEASMSAQPINGAGWQDPSRAYMQAQIMDQIAAKSEALRFVESLEGDELVVFYCAGDIAQVSFSGEVTLNGEPLARGGRVQGIAPGMPR